MGLAEAFQGAAKAVVNATGNIAESVTYNNVTAVAYDPATVTAPTETVETVTNLKIIWQNIDTRRIDGTNVLQRDREVIMTAQHLGTVVPSENGSLVRSSGETWRIVAVQGDAASATYVCQVRR